MIFYIHSVLLLVHLSRCSLVMDIKDPEQNGIHITDYCPSMPYCAEGSHVMCMYYNPKQLKGPKCVNSQNISMTVDTANKIVDTINEIRSKLALGQEKGQGGVALPRAYGMMRIQWDSELATFAQVWANQCLFRYDLCRASFNFSNPNQVIGLVRFTYPGWNPVSGRDISPGFDMDKVDRAVTSALETWYTRKAYATPAMMSSSPDWGKPPYDIRPKLYLALVDSHTTHIGCGISAFTEYVYYDNNADVNYNSILLICNLSTKLKAGEPIYKVTPPSIPGETIKCGCPEGYEEDTDCLCSKIYVEPMPIPMKKCNDCKPSVVLLPIITVEDAPPETDMTRSGPPEMSNFRFSDIIFSNATTETETPAHVLFNAPEHEDLPQIVKQPAINTGLRVHSKSLSVLDDIIEMPRVTLKPHSLTRVSALEDRYNGRKHPSEMKAGLQRNDHVSNKRILKQGSIFSKPRTFELPNHSHTYLRIGDKHKDVVPRKDFSNAQSLLNTYLKKKRNHESIDNLEVTTCKGPRKNHKPKFDEYLNRKFNYEGFNVSAGLVNGIIMKNSSEEADAKLMNLLDTLEQEVKHIELDMNDKEIFDAKIRKIYGTVVGGSTNLLNNRRRALVGQKDPAKYARLINRVNVDSTEDIDKMVYANEDKIKEAHSKFMDKYGKQNRLFKRPKSDNDNMENGIKSYRHTLDLDLKSDTRRSKHDPFNDKMDNPILDDIDFRNRNRLSEQLAELEKELKNRRVFKSSRDKMYYDDKKDTYYDDPLSADRIKYYQDKIDNIERKIRENRNYRFRKQMEQSASMRLRPTNREEILRPSRTKDMFYIPDRARFLHGF